MNVLSSLARVIPPSTYPGTWVLLFMLVGWLVSLGLVGLIILVVFLLLKRRQQGQGREGKQEPSSDTARQVGRFVIYVILFFSTWTMVASLIWFFETLYIALAFGQVYRIMEVGTFTRRPYLWHLVISYIIFLLTFPVSSIICLKTWGSIRRTKGKEKRGIVIWKRVFHWVQLFFSTIAFLLFSGFTVLFLFLVLTEGSRYLRITELAVVGVPLIPMIFSLGVGVISIVELLLLGRERLDS